MEGHAAESESHGGHAGEDSEHQPAGLGVAEGGYAVRFAATQFQQGEPSELSFALETDGGEPVTEFDQLHERRMHLIVVRRDGTAFRHLHPEMDAAGIWTRPGPVRRAGGLPRLRRLLGRGRAADPRRRPLRLRRRVRGARRSQLRGRSTGPAPTRCSCKAATRSPARRPRSASPSAENGQAVEDLQPYLGAKGHLVALREGDLAFLHVHPEEGHEVAADEIEFAATFPTAGRYRLYLQFKHDGVVRTAEYTVAVPR